MWIRRDSIDQVHKVEINRHETVRGSREMAVIIAALLHMIAEVVGLKGDVVAVVGGAVVERQLLTLRKMRHPRRRNEDFGNFIVEARNVLKSNGAA
jgi:hypothetical protein